MQIFAQSQRSKHMTILQQWSSHGLSGDSRPVPMSFYWRVSPFADVAPLGKDVFLSETSCGFLQLSWGEKKRRNWHQRAPFKIVKILLKKTGDGNGNREKCSGLVRFLGSDELNPWKLTWLAGKSPCSIGIPSKQRVDVPASHVSFGGVGLISPIQVAFLFSAVHHSDSLLERSYSFRCLPDGPLVDVQNPRSIRTNHQLVWSKHSRESITKCYVILLVSKSCNTRWENENFKTPIKSWYIYQYQLVTWRFLWSTHHFNWISTVQVHCILFINELTQSNESTKLGTIQIEDIDLLFRFFFVKPSSCYISLNYSRQIKENAENLTMTIWGGAFNPSIKTSVDLAILSPRGVNICENRNGWSQHLLPNHSINRITMRPSCIRHATSEKNDLYPVDAARTWRTFLLVVFWGVFSEKSKLNVH